MNEVLNLKQKCLLLGSRHFKSRLDPAEDQFFKYTSSSGEHVPQIVAGGLPTFV